MPRTIPLIISQVALTLPVIISGLLAGCAQPVTPVQKSPPALLAVEEQKQLSLAFNQRLDRQKRVLDLSYPILAAGSELCSDKTRLSMGFTFSNKQATEEKFRDTAIRDLGLGEPLQVIQVARTSPAEKAGVLSGDILVSLNGEVFGSGKSALQSVPPLLNSLEENRKSILLVARQGTTTELVITPEKICDYPVSMSSEDEVNAYADGKRILLTKGMLRFAQEDSDLALVIAHELAHNAFAHMPKTVKNALSGSILDLLAWSHGIPSPGVFAMGGSRVHLQGFEMEADYVALYLLARSGYPIEESANFWRRVATEYPEQIKDKGSDNLAATHPSSPARFLAMETTVKEIREKQAANKPLLPEQLNTSFANAQSSSATSEDSAAQKARQAKALSPNNENMTSGMPLL
ncbi:M48 family metalloprotease [Motiliproteus sp. MSK22-1]|uniref:M48 family metalloprotease n=1 Tax=Motiliproteus sp. MSK22-1 TaxID=1897630 RepID=UPI000976D7BA|nr:M48 family metalloprotease [Motiliproteus sp. MSK22-1]OMH38327.1 hypothetical protein BGP75_08785 [Motiliproteus sp. MSK22-1]